MLIFCNKLNSKGWETASKNCKKESTCPSNRKWLLSRHLRLDGNLTETAMKNSDEYLVISVLDMIEEDNRWRRPGQEEGLAR
jgi:hypothetical protein